MALPAGHKANPDIVNTGIDTVTGLPATTAGPFASPNPVVHESHPEAQRAMERNKTGMYARSKEQIEKEIRDLQEELNAVENQVPEEAPGSGSERWENSDWTKVPGQGINYPGEPTEEEQAKANLEKSNSAQPTPLSQTTAKSTQAMPAETPSTTKLVDSSGAPASGLNTTTTTTTTTDTTTSNPPANT